MNTQSKRKWWLFGIAGVVLIVFTYFQFRPRPPLPPLEVSMWYWHRPYRLTKPEFDSLRKMGVNEMFVNAGTIRHGSTSSPRTGLESAQTDLAVGGSASSPRNGAGLPRTGVFNITLAQQWSEGAHAFPVYLVFRFHPDMVKEFASIPEAQFINSVSRLSLSEADRAKKVGVKVQGIQLDFDSPTSRLPKYSRVLRAIRANLRQQGLSLSITVLTTWLPNREMQALAEAVDFFVPQFYEAITPKAQKDFRTIFSPERLRRGLATAGRIGEPFFAGLPSYGHALVYDDHGILLGLYRDTGPDEIAADPRFKLIDVHPSDSSGKKAAKDAWVGEVVADFDAPATSDAGHRSLLRYDMPTPEVITKALATLKAHRPPSCRGIILFRFPELGERLTTPVRSVEAAIRSEPIAPDIQFKVSIASVPWDMIESASTANRTPQEFRLEVVNGGNSGVAFHPDGLLIRLRLDRPGFSPVPDRLFGGRIEARVFRADSSFESTGQNATPSSSERGNLLEFRLTSLPPGDRVVIGPIRVPSEGATRLRGEWIALKPGGFESVRGEIAVISLESESNARK